MAEEMLRTESFLGAIKRCDRELVEKYILLGTIAYEWTQRCKKLNYCLTDYSLRQISQTLAKIIEINDFKKNSSWAWKFKERFKLECVKETPGSLSNATAALQAVNIYDVARDFRVQNKFPDRIRKIYDRKFQYLDTEKRDLMCNSNKILKHNMTEKPKLSTNIQSYCLIELKADNTPQQNNYNSNKTVGYSKYIFKKGLDNHTSINSNKVDEVVGSNENVETSRLIMVTNSNQNNRIYEAPILNIKNLKKSTIEISDDNKISEIVISPKNLERKFENNNQIDSQIVRRKRRIKEHYGLIELEENNTTSLLDNYVSNKTIDLSKNGKDSLYSHTGLRQTKLGELIQTNKDFEDINCVKRVKKSIKANWTNHSVAVEESIKISKANTDSIEISDDENNISKIFILPQTLEKKCEKGFQSLIPNLKISFKKKSPLSFEKDKFSCYSMLQDDAPITKDHNKLNSSETRRKNFEINKNIVTNKYSDTITNYEQALKILKMLEDFALLKCNFRAINFINNLEEIFKENL